MGKTVRIRLAFQTEKPVPFWMLGTHYWVNPGPKWTYLDQAVALAIKKQFPHWVELYSKKPATVSEPAQP